MMHVHAAAERVLLRPHADPAVDRRRRQRRMRGQRAHVLEDLRRQLTGSASAPARGVPGAGLLEQPVQDGEQECRGLAAAGLGAGEQIPPVHGGGNRIGLDGRGAREPELVNTLEKVLVEVKRGEWHEPS